MLRDALGLRENSCVRCVGRSGWPRRTPGRDFDSLYQGVAASWKPSVAAAEKRIARCLLHVAASFWPAVCGSGQLRVCVDVAASLVLTCCGSGQLSITHVAASQRVCCCGAVPGQSVDSLEELCRTTSCYFQRGSMDRSRAAVRTASAGPRPERWYVVVQEFFRGKSTSDKRQSRHVVVQENYWIWLEKSASLNKSSTSHCLSFQHYFRFSPPGGVATCGAEITRQEPASD